MAKFSLRHRKGEGATHDLWGGFSGTTSMVLSSLLKKYKAGAQYADLSSFTLQLEQPDLARSADCAVELKAFINVSQDLLQGTNTVAVSGANVY